MCIQIISLLRRLLYVYRDASWIPEANAMYKMLIKLFPNDTLLHQEFAEFSSGTMVFLFFPKIKKSN